MRVLIVVHGYPPSARGGSEVYAEAHARTLHDKWGDDVLVLTRDNDPARPEFDVRRETYRGVRVVRINNTFSAVRTFEESYAQPRLAAVAADVIDQFDPDVAHIHHLTCLSTLIPAHLHARGTPCFMTLHDYWLLCHRGQLLDRDGGVCGNPGACGRCLDDSAAVPASLGGVTALVRGLESRLPPAAKGVVRTLGQAAVTTVVEPAATAAVAARRLDDLRRATQHVSRFYVPSACLRDTFVEARFAADRLQVSPYGFEAARLPRQPARPDSQPLRIGFIGSLMVSKAPHVLLEAFRLLPSGAATLDLFGAYTPYHGDDTYRAVLEPLLETPGVTVHGWQPETEMARAYAGLDVLVVPSVWPENSPLVIHEALLSGVPVVASDIGGIPELVRDGENGLLFPPGNVTALHDALLRLLHDPALLTSLSGHATPVRSIADDTHAMRDDYQAALAPTATAAARVHAVVLNYRTPDQTLLAVRSLLASTPPLASVTVVDNSETVDCGRSLAELSDRVDYLSTGANLGYAGGMNVGIARALSAGATHVLLVNSDVTVPPDCCGRLLAALDAAPDAGIAGPTMAVRQAPDTIDSAGLSFDSTTGRMRMLHSGGSVSAAPGQVRRVDAVSGALMLITRDTFERIGLLEESYFFGFEDIDFCLRAATAGARTVVSPALAYHERAQSLGAQSADRLYYASRNHLRLAATAHGGGGGLVRCAGVALLNVASALKGSPARVPKRLGAVAGGIVDFARHREGQRR